MTPHPSQEYIITEEQLQDIKHFFSMPEHSMDDADYMMEDELLAEIRSRPHTSAPGEAAIRASEREKVLYELLYFINPDSRAGAVIERQLAALRQQGGEPE